MIADSEEFLPVKLTSSEPAIIFLHRRNLTFSAELLTERN